MGKPTFDSTAWTVITTAQGADSVAARDALAELCRRYWLPLYTYIRRQGHGRQEAEDLTQEFFAYLLDRDLVQQVDRDRGKFRTFILACLDHFLLSEWRRQRTAKRGAGMTFLPLNFEDGEACYETRAKSVEDPRIAFDRQWAQTVLETAAKRLREEYKQAGRLELFQVLEGCLGQGGGSAAYPTAAVQLEMSEGAVRVAVHRMRKRFGALTREEIAQTVSDEQEVKEELRYLIQVLGDQNVNGGV